MLISGPSFAVYLITLDFMIILSPFAFVCSSPQINLTPQSSFLLNPTLLHPKLKPFTNRSHILPLTSLSIHPNKAAWVLYVDAICINYDGNAFDAALIAMVEALRNSTLSSISCVPHPFPSALLLHVVGAHSFSSFFFFVFTSKGNHQR